jgi:adenylate cyclase
VNDDLEHLQAQADDQLLRWGADADEIDHARASGHIGLLAIATAALPGHARYTADELAARVGIDRELSRRFWRAMGFPDVADDERVFTDQDVEALATAHALIQLGVTDVDVAIQLTRVIGSSMARIAEATVGGRSEVPVDPSAGEFFALTAEAGLATQARLLEYVWRRHLQAAARRRLLAVTRSDRVERPTVTLAVGFADLVGFTALSQQVDEVELAEVVSRFEELAFDQVTGHGGRVAKMIGDEVMFVVDDVGAALETALALAEAYADDEVLSDVRVGLACGDVLAREGDYYGPVVNLASRIVNIALPGSVVVSETVHAALADDPRFDFHSLRPRNLKDIGRVRLWRIRRGKR